ncbi:hypothetical protein JHK85_001413 [Glycine max]|nr:hypothetical protein JHK85_001413 [Glycine max]
MEGAVGFTTGLTSSSRNTNFRCRPTRKLKENPTLLLELWLEENPTYTPLLGTRVLKPSSVLKAQSFLREIEGNMEDVEEANRAAAESCH